MLSRISLMAMTIFVLSSCSHVPITDTASPDYLPPIGSQLVLTQPIQLTPGQHVTYLQDGNVTNAQQFNRYQPHCQLWVKISSQDTNIIQPDSFTMSNVYNDSVRYGMREPIMVAGYDAGAVRPFNFYSDQIVDRQVTMHLVSDNQPWIWRMICSSGWDEVWQADDPSIDQMRLALRGIAEIKLAE